jgi:hypothetical protein
LSFAVASSSTVACTTSGGIAGFTKYIVQAGSSGASVFLQPYGSDLSIIATKQ